MTKLSIRPRSISEAENYGARLSFDRIRKQQFLADSLVPNTAEHRAAMSVLFLLQDSTQAVIDAQEAIEAVRVRLRRPAA